MVYLKYNSVKLPVLDNYNIAKSSQEITFSDLKCDFTGHQKADLPEKYQEVRVVEESKVNREIEKIEYEEKKDVKELSFESKVKEKISICKVHGYSSQETRSGKNKIIFDDIKETVNQGITCSIKNGVITLNGTASGVVNFYSNPINISAGKYTLSKNMEGTWSLGTATSSLAILLQQKEKDGSYTTVKGGELTAYSSAKNFTTLDLAEGTYRIRVFIAIGNILNNFTWRPQLEEGENFTGFEQGGLMPSVEFPSEIKNVKESVRINIQNKNLCGSLSQGYDNKGTITNNNQFVCTTDLINVKSNTQYIISNNLNLPIASISYYKDEKFVRFQANIGSFTITIPEGINQVRINIYREHTLSISDFTYIQFEEGKKAKPYLLHAQQAVTFPFTEGQKLMQGDYLADDGIHHKRKQVVLDGSDDEGWNYNGGSLSNNISAFTANISNLISVENTDTKVRVMCNKTIGLSASEATKLQKYNAIAVISDKRIYLCVQRSSFSTSPSTLKTWLQSNPITVEYELAEEVVEPYTVEQQKAWNNMQNLVSYVGINNINSSTKIDVKYPVRIKKEIVPETYDKLLYTGYIDDYVFDEMRELDEDINISFTLLSPQKIATLRTCIAVGTYEIKDLIENIILAPLIDDGFTLKEINIVNKSLTVNFLVETVEYCMNNLSNKYNFWWYIDENKNIYVKDIETMFKEEPMYIYDDKHTINGLEYVKPITNSYDYANVINFKNVRIYEYSRLRMNKKEVAEAHNPLIDGQVTNIKQNDQITFNFPIDIKKENIIKSANSNGITNTNIIYGIYVEGTYEDNTDFSFFVSFDTLNNLYKISDNLGFDGESTDSEKEFLLMRDSFFSNLITGIKYNNGNKKINSIKAINSDSTLIYNVNKFLNDKGILEKKNIISKTGIVERTIDMKESWKTVQELTEIGASYLNKNSLNYADELEIKLDKDKFQVGKILYINKFMIDGRYVVTEIQRTDQNNDDEFLVKCKNANILDNFIDIFRQENEQTSSDKVYQLYVTHYEEEGISERFEVVQ